MVEKTDHSTANMFDLTGKVAVVTGGARGIGQAIAEGLAQAGSNVVLADIDYTEAQMTCSKIEKTGVRAVAVKCDVRQTEDAATLTRTTIEESD